MISAILQEDLKTDGSWEKEKENVMENDSELIQQEIAKQTDLIENTGNNDIFH